MEACLLSSYGEKKKKRFKELAEKTADTGHVSCQKDPTQSAHSKEPDKRDRRFVKLRFESAEQG